MRIVIAGGTGFLGRPLAAGLASDGHSGSILSRRAASRTTLPGFKTVTWAPNGEAGMWSHALDGSDAVINLAGESIAAGRWTPARKRRILDSRVLATRSLVRAMGTL